VSGALLLAPLLSARLGSRWRLFKSGALWLLPAATSSLSQGLIVLNNTLGRTQLGPLVNTALLGGRFLVARRPGVTTLSTS
jgi:hypothetical protein